MSAPDPQTIIVACAADDHYVRPLAVMVQSALANLDPGRRLAVFVVDGGIAPMHRHALATAWDPARLTMHFVAPSEVALAGLPLWGRMPIATYYKLLVPALLPADAPKAIWLDCDVVVAGDLARLWAAELGDHCLLAVQDHAVPLVSSANGVAAYRELGLDPGARYFNAGVMVLNLTVWRREDLADRAIGYLRRYRDTVVFLDQEALNAVLAGRWAELDPRWNCIATPRGRDAGATDPWIHHFTGSLKPWVTSSAAPSHDLYFRYLDQTPWAGWRPDPSLARMVLGIYHSSRLRRVLYPAEEGLMRLVRAITRRDAWTPRSR